MVTPEPDPRLSPRVKRVCLLILALAVTIPVVGFVVETVHIPLSPMEADSPSGWEVVYETFSDIIIPLSLVVVVTVYLIKGVARFRGDETERAGQFAQRALLAFTLIIAWPIFGEQLFAALTVDFGPIESTVAGTVAVFGLQMLFTCSLLVAPLVVALWTVDSEIPYLRAILQHVLNLVMLGVLLSVVVSLV